MIRLRNFLYPAIGIPVFIILLWSLAIPDSFIKNTVEEAISGFGKSGISASLKGVRKGIFFSVHADSLEMDIDGKTALKITDISGRINFLHFFKRQFAFSVRGKIGTGVIEGFFKLPLRFVGAGKPDGAGQGSLKIKDAELDSVPYLASAGLEARGLVSADLSLKNNTLDVTFKAPDADIHGSVKGVTLPVKSFHKIQGALSMKENSIRIKSISLEADRGYARIKGDVTGGIMNLVLELMPSANELSSMESALISRYQISPGYFIIPIKGPLL